MCKRTASFPVWSMVLTLAMCWTRRKLMRPTAHIWCCTGPDCDLRRTSDPLIKHLRARGYIRLDPLGLGLDIADDGALITAGGEKSRPLYAVGPLRKGSLWETTAVPELRTQAASLARALGSSVRTEMQSSFQT